MAKKDSPIKPHLIEIRSIPAVREASWLDEKIVEVNYTGSSSYSQSSAMRQRAIDEKAPNGANFFMCHRPSELTNSKKQGQEACVRHYVRYYS